MTCNSTAVCKSFLNENAFFQAKIDNFSLCYVFQALHRYFKRFDTTNIRREIIFGQRVFETHTAPPPLPPPPPPTHSFPPLKCYPPLLEQSKLWVIPRGRELDFQLLFRDTSVSSLLIPQGSEAFQAESVI